MDNIKFTWELTFRQKGNGFTQERLLKKFLELISALATEFGAEHNLTIVESRLGASRTPAKTKR